MKYIKQLMVLVLAVHCAGVYAMDLAQNFQDLVRKHNEQKSSEIKFENKALYDAAHRGDALEVIRELYELGDKADSCGAIEMASLGGQHEVIKILAQWCCCAAQLKLHMRPHPRPFGEMIVESSKEAQSNPELHVSPRNGPAGPFGQTVQGSAMESKKEEQSNSVFLAPRGAAQPIALEAHAEAEEAAKREAAYAIHPEAGEGRMEVRIINRERFREAPRRQATRQAIALQNP